MVDRTEGQFYTMEGIAAAVLMVLTAYLVMSTTSVYTPGDSHIIDMQLEQIGNDALKMLDTRLINNISERSLLENYTRTNRGDLFSTAFNEAVNPNTAGMNQIYFKADIFYVNSTGIVKNITDFATSSRKYTGGENAIRVSRWVFVEGSTSAPSSSLGATDYRTTKNQTVLLEVLLWRS